MAEKSKERRCLEKMMKMLCGNRRIVLQSDFLLPYDLMVQELGSDLGNWGKVIGQEHTHSSRAIDGCDEESIEIVTDSFIDHILGKGGLSWNIDKESPHNEIGTGEIPVIPFKHLQVHRCNWCGKIVTPENTSLKITDDITILCSDCFDFERKGNTIIITKLNIHARIER